MDDLIVFLRARLGDDEMWAIEGSREATTGQAPEGGAHWRWVSSNTDTEFTPDLGEPTLGHTAGEPFVSLLSREEWDFPLDTPGPQFVLHSEEVPSAAAGHIARHDPARVLRDVEAKRQAIEHYEQIQALTQDPDAYVLAEGAVMKQMQIMALPYADHPDYRDDWRP
ncbi:DUF6221 family protein [Streptomyces sp. NPDC059783]|uniref:DUF6221 family protein n=1 Tax=Streptomyces sp. NPDC059783 TaxID=3346944 RepID=UPI0036643B7B